MGPGLRRDDDLEGCHNALTPRRRWPVALLKNADRGVPQSQTVGEADIAGIDMREMVENGEIRLRTQRRGQLDAFAIGDDRIVAAMDQEHRPGDRSEIAVLEVEAPQLVPDRRRQLPYQRRHPRGIAVDDQIVDRTAVRPEPG